MKEEGRRDGNFDVKAEAVAEAMEEGADDFLWGGVFAVDAGHVWLPKARHDSVSLEETFASRKVVRSGALW